MSQVGLKLKKLSKFNFSGTPGGHRQLELQSAQCGPLQPPGGSPAHHGGAHREGQGPGDGHLQGGHPLQAGAAKAAPSGLENRKK